MRSNRYDLIIGRDLMVDIGLDVMASKKSIQWDDAVIPWRDMENTTTDAFFSDNQEGISQKKT